MHPPSPILNSYAPRIQAYFGLMFALALFTAWQVARMWHRLEPVKEDSRRANAPPGKR